MSINADGMVIDGRIDDRILTLLLPTGHYYGVNSCPGDRLSQLIEPDLHNNS